MECRGRAWIPFFFDEDGTGPGAGVLGGCLVTHVCSFTPAEGLVKKRFLAFPVLLATAIGLSALTPGCSKDDESPVNPQPGTARVMVIHASPDAPGVDLYVDNVRADSNLTFLENTGYVTVPAGIRNVKVNVTGTNVTVIQGPVPVAAGAVYSVFAADSVASITPIVLQDTLTAPAAGKAHVRFVHLSPNAPAVDITLESGAVVFGNRAFGQSTAFTPLDAGSYVLQVRVAGTSTVVLTLPSITLTAGKIYTVYAKGFAGVTTGVQALGAEIIVNN